MYSQARTKVMLHLIPLLGFCFFLNIMDKSNVSIAALKMNSDIGLTAAGYGLGAGIFFIGYFIFEVPSNLFMQRYGARRWIARIMLSWGIISAATAAVQNQESFYVLRFLLGLAEAGFFPGIVYYFGSWFSKRDMAVALALFSAFNPIASAVAAPISTALLTTTLGWRSIFIVEGLPAVLLAFAVLRWLPNRLEDAQWLSDQEKDAISAQLAGAGRMDHNNNNHRYSWHRVVKDPQTIIMCFQYLLILTSSYALILWLPLIIKATGVSSSTAGLLSAIPFAFAAIGMILWGRHSTATNERFWHMIIPCVIGAAAFAAGAVTGGVIVPLIFLTIATVAVYAGVVQFWALPRVLAVGATAATATALVNSFGNLGGFVGPYFTGLVKDATGSFEWSLGILAILLLIGGLLTFVTGRMGEQAARLNHTATTASEPTISSTTPSPTE
jgi:MFS transporter, ACS family, tartrate transporter